MPNWCQNTIGASEEVIKSLYNAEGKVDFNTVVPMPEHQPDLSKPNPFWRINLSTEDEQKFPDVMNWYGWSIAHWGTKWNVDPDNIYIEQPHEIGFDTAWGPPMALVEALSKKFPKEEITIWYEEPGMVFSGEVTYLNGIVVNEIDYSWKLEHRNCPRCENGYGNFELDDVTHVEYSCGECGAHWDVTEDSVKIIEEPTSERLYELYVQDYKRYHDKGQEPACYEEWLDNEYREIMHDTD